MIEELTKEETNGKEPVKITLNETIGKVIYNIKAFDMRKIYQETTNFGWYIIFTDGTYFVCLP